MQKQNCAVIGVGTMGKIHVRAYKELPQADLVAVCEKDTSDLNLFAEDSKIKCYEDYQEMIRKEKIDIVSICVPTNAHYKIAKECIENKINVIIEKPITDKLKEAEELLALAKINKVKLMVGHIERFNPVVKKTKEIINAGKLGEIITIIARRVGGFPKKINNTDIAIDLAIHDIDIVNYLLNDLPVEAKSYRSNNNLKSINDSVEFFLRYKKSSAFIQANWITPVKIRKLNITGSDGYMEMDYINQEIDLYENHYNMLKKDVKNYEDYLSRFAYPNKQNVKVEKKEPIKEELIYFLDCVKNDTEIDSQYSVSALKIAMG